jgi:hypothetical protein
MPRARSGGKNIRAFSGVIFSRQLQQAGSKGQLPKLALDKTIPGQSFGGPSSGQSNGGV